MTLVLIAITIIIISVDTVVAEKVFDCHRYGVFRIRRREGKRRRAKGGGEADNVMEISIWKRH